MSMSDAQRAIAASEKAGDLHQTKYHLIRAVCDGDVLSALCWLLALCNYIGIDLETEARKAILEWKNPPRLPELQAVERYIAHLEADLRKATVIAEARKKELDELKATQKSVDLEDL